MTHHLNKNNNNHHPIATAITIFTLAIIATASSMATAPTVATATTEATTITPSASSSEIQLSPEPVYQELRRPISNIPINETHLSVTYSGNGTLTLPETGETINTISNGTVLVSFMTQSAVGSETLRTQDGAETATVTIHEIVPFDPAATNGETRGIAIAVITTESTEGGGRLAPLNGMILVGIDEILPNEDSHLTLREWQRGTTTTPTTTPEEQTTNAAADTNATIIAEQEGEQQQEEQTTTTMPPTPLLE